MDHVDGWPFQVVLSGSETILRGSEVPMSCLSLQNSGNFSLVARPANFSKDFGKSTPPPRVNAPAAKVTSGPAVVCLADRPYEL